MTILRHAVRNLDALVARFDVAGHRDHRSDAPAFHRGMSLRDTWAQDARA